jgi:hypothetical protein
VNISAGLVGRALAAVLVLLFTCGCAVSGLSPFAYPHFWDFTKSQPKESDLVGTYVILKTSGSLPSFHSAPNVRVTLNADHTAAFSAIPEYDEWGETLMCTSFASGTWKLSRIGEWTVNFWPNERSPNKTGRQECDSMNTPFWVLGQRAPFRLFLSIGDPDNDTGIEFRRQ